MQLWQLDIMGSVMIIEPTPAGGVTEAKLISRIDDHSRYSVIGKVVPRATARAVCTAFIAAMTEYGVPEEVPSDIQRSPIHRFGVSRQTLHTWLTSYARDGLAGLMDRSHRPPSCSHQASPMALWRIDTVGRLFLTDDTECKVVTGVDDHSRFCVLAAVVVRAAGRAVCLPFAEALPHYGVPDEVLTENAKQFTDKFGRAGEVLFDQICHNNGITHRLTEPTSPTTTGKVERFHQNFPPRIPPVRGKQFRLGPPAAGSPLPSEPITT
jgi:hypothetical protein